MKIGRLIDTGEDFIIYPRELLQNHTFVTGITNSGKTNTILKIIEEIKSPGFNAKFHELQTVLISVKDDYTLIPRKYKDFILFSREQYGSTGMFDVDFASEVGKKIRKLGLSIVIKTSDFKTLQEKQTFVGRFMEGFRSVSLEKATPALVVIDEADLMIPNSKEKNHPSRDILIDALARARSEGISILLATQFATLVSPYARLECTNRITGLTVEPSYRKAVAEMFGDKELFDKLWDLKKGEFYFRGQAFPSGLSFVKVDRSTIEMPQMGISYGNSAGKEASDLLKVSVLHEGHEPLIVQQQRQIAELQLLLKAEKAKHVESNRIENYNIGYERGYNDAINNNPFQKLRVVS